MAGMSAERAAALQRAHKSAPPHFVTKRVADPNMIPMLVAAGVEFGAVKVLSLLLHPSCWYGDDKTEGAGERRARAVRG